MRALFAVTFRAKFLEREVLEVMKDDNFLEGGHGEVIAIRLWEVELMIRLRMTEDEYLKLGKPERARKIVAMKLNKWFEMLEYQLMKDDWAKK